MYSIEARPDRLTWLHGVDVYIFFWFLTCLVLTWFEEMLVHAVTAVLPVGVEGTRGTVCGGWFSFRCRYVPMC
jgi:hypothetical protein